MEKVYGILKQADVWFLATDDNGQPRVRPMAPVNIFDGRLYFMTSHSKPVSRQMKENSKVEICALIAEDRWIRIAATAINDDSRDAKKSFLDAHPDLVEEHPLDDPDTQVLYLKDAVATISSFDGILEVIEF
ncbi:MAG: pyridoxamine 5'-phosphate oxidase family protein [Alphaproteobacteria bacterium]|nr:pyridoxamine 5'-phosphate oxidase family protein [Alphaproteobacteria bacterium]